MLGLLVGIIILLIIFFHASYVMGWKAGFNFAIIGWIVAFILEDLGVRGGFIFGKYYFTSILGPKLDVIPLVVPCLWVIASYMAVTITNLFLDHSPFQTNFSLPRQLYGAALGALLMTSTDVNADPIAVENHFWIWVNHGSYFGVPIHNYVGWFFVSFVTILVHSYIVRHDLENAPLDHLTINQQRWSIFPLILYLVGAAGAMVINFDHVLALVTFYLFGIPLMASFWQWVKWYRHQTQVSTTL